ncbi:UDP-4-amino-4,6-dideoxy-N-acetyl-beta-L-altrosamine transaminase [Polynucleobacter paneuropaeus]|uniref:UDP-4-amino-4, 6-dideoxy-N-acetyl-beta-L-altrosamine transaminase n=1 Tax=Polynucleobacter paneuropaeus TaxID=2527775 RepID=A0A9Q2ZW58_9BURK|nr:UDP-4-amino-4,6-dideoxy-N-acetyl-beta-L-altrosamine transaminase [Polynucleobacter paneuropaeus]
MIPYGLQSIDEADIAAVVEVLRSEYLTQGPVVPLFENAVAQYVGAKFGVAVNSATSALHIACMALGLKSGDILWTTPISFVASSNCALYCGAQVDFVDIDPRTYNISIASLEEKLVSASKIGKLPKIVIPVHLCGQAADMAAIFKLSQKYGFRIIEDASHAIGGKYAQEFIGGCTFSDITVFSFHPVKIITTGEGGMCTTNNVKLAERMNLLRSHGITRDRELMKNPSDGPWYYEQIDLGFNYRMTEIQAALGLSQMKRIDGFIARRTEIAINYSSALSALPIVLPYQDLNTNSSFHLYVIRLKLNELNKSHKFIFEDLRSKGIGVNLHYIPIYRHPYYQLMGFMYSNFPQAEQYYEEAISIPVFSGMSDVQQLKVINTLEEVLSV